MKLFLFAIYYVLCLGNSFTYFHDCPAMLTEIAASQGDSLVVRAETVGGYSFYRHLQDLNSISAIEARAYDYVFLQDQSQAAARYASDRKRYRQLLQDAWDLVRRIRIYSPDAHIFIERTWAYKGNNNGGFESLETFDRLLADGTRQITRKTRTSLSPIGEAFMICRWERSDINLFEEDLKHQTAYGSYLKSCINYLEMVQRPFVENAPTLDLDEEKCAYLRNLAERVVLQ